MHTPIPYIGMFFFLIFLSFFLEGYSTTTHSLYSFATSLHFVTIVNDIALAFALCIIFKSSSRLVSLFVSLFCYSVTFGLSMCFHVLDCFVFGDCILIVFVVFDSKCVWLLLCICLDFWC